MDSMQPEGGGLMETSPGIQQALAGIEARPVHPSRAWYQLDAEGLSLTFRADTPYEVWERETRALLDVAQGIQWWAGDALAFGEAAYGERYSQVLDCARYRFDSIDRMARVARAIPPYRRRAGVGFYQHMAVAALPVASQEGLLDQAESSGWTVAEARAAARVEAQRLERARAALLPPPITAPPDGIWLAVADARALPLPDGSTDLIVTSPPYGLDSETVTKYRVPDEASAWVHLMVAFCAEAYRILRPQGRLVVNVPLDTTSGGHRPTYAQLVAAALAAGFTYRTTIIWADGHLGKSTARGSVDSAGAINVITPAEAVLVAHKGAWIRAAGSGSSDLTREEWVSWTNGFWQLAGEGRPWEGFEAAFPLELARRLVKLFSYREDVVVDPFVGSGTTALAAHQAGRRCYGYDLDPQAIASAQRRLAGSRGSRARSGHPTAGSHDGPCCARPGRHGDPATGTLAATQRVPLAARR